MGFVESLGWIAIICVAGYLFIMYLLNKDNTSREIEKYSKYSDKCKDLQRSYRDSIDSGKPIMSHYDLQQQLGKILKEPNERKIVMDRIEEIKKRDEERNQESRKQRKIGYKYEQEIFEIFDTKRYILEEKLVLDIQNKFKLSTKEAIAIFNLWRENGLIRNSISKEHLWEIGYLLTSTAFSLDKDDLTWGKWLKQNGKTMESNIDEIVDDLPF